MSRTENMTDWRSNASKRRTRGLIETTLARIISLHDGRSVAAHLVTILRKKKIGENKDKSPIFRDPYTLTDEEFLKILEAYEEELDLEALESLNPEEE
jgi:hypothetical protein